MPDDNGSPFEELSVSLGGIVLACVCVHIGSEQNNKAKCVSDISEKSR